VRSKGTVHALKLARKMHYPVYLEVRVYAKNREKKSSTGIYHVMPREMDRQTVFSDDEITRSSYRH
jgi:hypothetical protein